MKKHIAEQTVIFFSVSKWLILSSAVGIMIGALMSIFLKLLHSAEDSRNILPFNYYYLLPFALMLTIWIVRTFDRTATGHGTEKVIEAVHKKDGFINVKVIPVKLVATIITIFAGGSVGKEGPGAQIGAGAASFASTILKFSKKDRKKLVICGISAGFASVFGTPIAGAVFGIEVLIIGVIMYDVLLPSFIAGFAAFTTAKFLGVHYTYYDIDFFRSLNLDLMLISQVVVAGIFFGVVSDLFITITHKVEAFMDKIPYDRYLKAFVAGLIMVILSLLISDKYLGLGLDTISNALHSEVIFSDTVHWYDFLLKTLFTSLTLGAGGSGGVITPVFFVGATSGVAFGHIIGDNIALFAALGFVSVLAGTTNSPIASIIMAVELFGTQISNYAAVSVVIAFLITGHRSVFPSQRIGGFSKAENIEVGEGSDIEHTPISVNMKDIEKLRHIRSKLRYKSIKWQIKHLKDEKKS
ncbi:chloride channel protein [Sulfurospirillum arcachonense]|uniref:chloride channel protein n=1 Tax=Sulfurospirillum arcachonense TaxID=57666 RepID=UPI000469CCAE|nr:chloride channel protein [Sulfurospirillum arcachonense]